MNLTMDGDEYMIHPDQKQPRTSSIAAQDKKAREMIRAMVQAEKFDSDQIGSRSQSDD